MITLPIWPFASDDLLPPMACRASRSGRHSPYPVHHPGERHGHSGRQLFNFRVAEASHSMAREQVVVRTWTSGPVTHGGDEFVFGMEVG